MNRVNLITYAWAIEFASNKIYTMDIRKYRVTLVRHGESTYNAENLFTGWTDVPLTEKGSMEAKRAGKELLKQKIEYGN